MGRSSKERRRQRRQGAAPPIVEKKRQPAPPPEAREAPAPASASPAVEGSVPPPAPASDYPKRRTLVISRASGPMAWAVIEALTSDPNWTSHVAADARVVRVRVGEGWEEDLPGANGRTAQALEDDDRCLFLGVCQDDAEIVFAGMSIRDILEKDCGLPGLADVLAGAADVRVAGATFPETLPKITEMLWIMADNGRLDPDAAEAASRALARAAIVRAFAGDATPADLNLGALRAWAPEILRPHERAVSQALVGLDYAYRAAIEDWGRSGRIHTAPGDGRDLRIAICETLSPFLPDWLWDAEKPDLVLRLEPGGFWCRASNRSDVTLAAFAAALRTAAPGATIVLTGEDRTVGNRLRENPFIPDIPLNAAEIEKTLIRSL